jgi:hypothetical protein
MMDPRERLSKATCENSLAGESIWEIKSKNIIELLTLGPTPYVGSSVAQRHEASKVNLKPV